MSTMTFDTETTGLPVWKKPSDLPAQPHLVQLAIILRDANRSEMRQHNVIIRPDGWTIGADMTAIHGISHERAMDEGIPESDAVDLYLACEARALVRVAHNISFDHRIMRIAMLRYGVPKIVIEQMEARPSFCTCNRSTPIVNLPPTEKMRACGMMGPKSAGMAECIKHFFGEELPGAHDAMVDARACARIYDHLCRLP
jgi:DNA polymerase-3 subunit epsilon